MASLQSRTYHVIIKLYKKRCSYYRIFIYPRNLQTWKILFNQLLIRYIKSTWLGQSWSRLWTSRTRGYTACSYIKGKLNKVFKYPGIKMYKKHISSEITWQDPQSPFWWWDRPCCTLFWRQSNRHHRTLQYKPSITLTPDVADPGSGVFWPLDPRSGMGKKPDPDPGCSSRIIFPRP